jgi:DNA primase large subunit
MRIFMGLYKNRHGTYFERRAVPKRLKAAVAQVLRNGKAQQSFLQESLRTKELAEAKRKASALRMQFDRMLAQAEARIAERPLRATLSELEIGPIIQEAIPPCVQDIYGPRAAGVNVRMLPTEVEAIR